MTHSFDALILGGGAAGLMCAIEAGKRGRRVAVLEHANRLGKKILISGGGRCNFTNLHCLPGNFISSNPHFAKSALARYTPADFIALVEKHGIPYHEKTLGQLFCDRSSRDILAMLEAECRDAKVTIFLNTNIQQVERTTEFIVRSKTLSPKAQSSVHPRSSLPPEASRFRRSAPLRSATTSRASSASPSVSPGPDLCR